MVAPSSVQLKLVGNANTFGLVIFDDRIPKRKSLVLKFMTKVSVFGPLADHLGKSEWSFVLSSAHEVFQALEANTLKLVSFFSNNPYLEYRLIVNGVDVSSDGQLFAKGIQLQSIDVVPVIRASGNAGAWLALIGIAIVALVLLVPTGGQSGWAALMAGNLSTGASFALTMGVALTLAGITQMLYGSQRTDALEKGDNKPSYLFNGAVNTYSQGNPVPVGFGGPLRVGSQVISVGIRSVDITDAS